MSSLYILKSIISNQLVKRHYPQYTGEDVSPDNLLFAASHLIYDGLVI